MVTGGGSGIGRATAHRLAAEGAAVLVADLVAEAAERVVEEIRQAGGWAAAAQVDVTREGDAERAVATCRAQFGSLDGLVTCAGFSRPAPFLEMTTAHWSSTLAVHLTGTFLCAQAAARAMVAQGRGGAVVCVSSSAGAAYVSPLGCDYHVAKTGILGLVRTLACELAPQRIRVNAIGPGMVMTPMTAPRLAIAEISQVALARIPLGRFADPAEMAASIAFLLSEDASYVTGQCLFADGGSLARI